MNLIQEKLDVVTKKRSNIFNWRGQFTPEFVEYILESFTQKGDHILDPFAGSGTVLFEAARHGNKASGFEINPAAYAMSSFFSFCNMPFADRYDFSNNFEIKLNKILPSFNNHVIFTESSDFRQGYSDFLSFAKECDKTFRSKSEQIFLLNLLFLSERDKNFTIKNSINKSFNYLKNSLLGLPFSEYEINSYLKDSKTVGTVLKNKADFILTSPPYINVFNYHQNYRAIIEVFEFDIMTIAHSEFGSNRKNRGNRFKTVIQYCIDMELAIYSCWRALKPGSSMVMVLGKQSNVRGIPFYNGKLIMEILESSGGFNQINSMQRQFKNKFGDSIKEDIIITTKSGNLDKSMHAREIALNHLNENLKIAKDDVYDDLIDAISNISDITPSPIYSTNYHQNE